MVTGVEQGVGRQLAFDPAASNAAAVIVDDFFARRAEAGAEDIRAGGGEAGPVENDAGKARAEQSISDVTPF